MSLVSHLYKASGSTRRTGLRTFVTRQSVHGDDYKPFSNENSSCGTTCDTVKSHVAHDGIINPEKQMESSKYDADHDGEVDFLEWSAANKCISEVFESEEWAIFQPSEPSVEHYQPPRPAAQEGLFKPNKKREYRSMDE